MMVEVMRHGRTMLQEERRYVGSTDDSLSPKGAQELAAASKSPARVYVTRLRRTSQTAALVFPDAELVVAPGLEEMDFGSFEGQSHKELEHDPAYRAWLNGSCFGRCPGGEARDEFAQRVASAFARLLDQAILRGEESVTIVAHGGTIMAVMERFGRPRREFFAWQVVQGCGLVLDAFAWTRTGTLRLVGEIDHRREDVSS